MDERLLAVRRQLATDFRYYADKCLIIRTKDGDLLPLRLNRAQEHLLAEVERQRKERGFVRVIILKGRQQGLSTSVGGLMYQGVTHRKGAKALVLAHTAESTSSLFEMVHRYHNSAPEAVRPSTKYSSRRELSFDKLDSAYRVATAGGEGVGRGFTFTHVHASEMAFWPKSSARDIWNGLTKAVGRVPGTEVYVESTANGCSGLFYEQWWQAMKGETDYAPVFVPWFWEEGYRAAVPETFARTMEEDDLVEKYGVDDEQLQWRRLQIAETSREQFRQEYPFTMEEAFLASGMPVFNPDQISSLLKLAPDMANLPRYTMEVRRDEKKDEVEREWAENSLGELIEYLPLQPHEQYVIGADVAKGIRGGDWSVAHVLDSKKRQTAVLRCQVIPDYFAEMLVALGERYNMAFMAVEANDHGVLTVNRLFKEFNYPHLYTNVQYDKEQDKETVIAGFVTNVKTRPMILDKLRAAMRDREITVQDKETLREMQTFIVNESGKMEAEAGQHDDCVLSLAIANHAHEGIGRVVEATDDFYSDVDF